ncbi:MAG TPA: hypothetical protein VI796_01550, partial [Candidatus Thermoplasmatota archaeon]|nr:hypothetical protein [Candidatus Thermoplasmatota archaeon]
MEEVVERLVHVAGAEAGNRSGAPLRMASIHFRAIVVKDALKDSLHAAVATRCTAGPVRWAPHG